MTILPGCLGVVQINFVDLWRHLWLLVLMYLLTISLFSQAWDIIGPMVWYLIIFLTQSKPLTLPFNILMRVARTSHKNCWSGKHKGYGWKSKVAVGLDGKACYVSPPYPGLFHDMKILK